MPTVRQTNFRAGELSPYLWGRTDLPLYGAGLRTCRNMFISKAGAVHSRPGTKYITRAKYDGLDTRLIPFSAGDGEYESYALQFGHNFIRFIQGGGEVLTGPGPVYEVATPYSSTEIWEIQYAQLGDVLVLAHPNHDPLQLRRKGHVDWTLEKVSFAALRPAARDIPDLLGTGQGFTGYMVVVPGAWAPNRQYEIGRLVTNGGNVYQCIDPGISAGAGGPTGTTSPIIDNGVAWIFVSVKNEADETHPVRRWQWVWTAIVKDNETGALYETLAEPVIEYFDGADDETFVEDSGFVRLILNDLWAVYPDMPIRLRRGTTNGLLSAPDGHDTYTVQEYLLYRGDGGLFGLVASTKSREFIDPGDTPDYAVQPPMGTNPFGEETEASGAAAPFDTRRLDRPSCVAFFQGRLVFGGSTRRPDELDASKRGDFLNWDPRLYLDVRGEALNFALAYRKKETMRTLGALGRYLAPFTESSAWSVAGVQGSQLDFDSIDANVEDEVGSRHLQPLVVDGALLFARTKGRGVRALVPTGAQKAFAGVDISESAHHLFTGHDKELVDWCYAEDPFGLVYAVRSDGELLCLTFERDKWAWTHFDTFGAVESVCSIPEGDEDAVYLVVRRLIDGTERRYIERMTSRISRGGASANDIELLTPPDDICLDSALEYFGPGDISTITGLEHLEGEEVWVLAPGNAPIGPLQVVGGELELGEELAANLNTSVGPKLVAHVGLLFTPELETLDIAAGDARLRQKTVAYVGLEVEQSRGVKVGMDFDNLNDGQLRDLDDDYVPVSNATELITTPVPSEWNKNARVCMRQGLPLPVTVVGLSREVVTGD